ncbi:hypothetical protein [Blastopirellula marina]|uniref:DUF7674 domain-containing protein n=1 Tax=Blastopirellula marina TaxID=124 RepID=A0A2S8FMI5_9BACT|nr:hypothetical protein [Blastopirellula marina]PQO33074.1 hypothetical protein C5Y98_18235 [Blastopirellula marina]PTL43241.1 hypothetical protein C5Y97_18245 [Blastopirellula marina]
MKLSAAEAIARIEATYPELSATLHDDVIDGLPHLQIAEWSRLAQRQIDTHDRPGFSKTCVLFLELWNHAKPAVVNALNVSFLEPLTVAKQSWAYHQMPAQMRTAYDDMSLYNRRMHGEQKGNE